jgi:hypothetical protein
MYHRPVRVIVADLTGILRHPGPGHDIMTTGTIGFTCFLGVASHTAGGFGLGMHGLFQPDKPAFFISGRRVTLAA